MSLKTIDDELAADPEFAPADKARVTNAATAEVARIRAEKHVAQTAHACAKKHVPKTARGEVVEPAACHDCGRMLVSDAGTDRILVCPRVHGLRPKKMSTIGDGAVECGVSNG